MSYFMHVADEDKKQRDYRCDLYSWFVFELELHTWTPMTPGSKPKALQGLDIRKTSVIVYRNWLKFRKVGKWLGIWYSICTIATFCWVICQHFLFILGYLFIRCNLKSFQCTLKKKTSGQLILLINWVHSYHLLVLRHQLQKPVVKDKGCLAKWLFKCKNKCEKT